MQIKAAGCSQQDPPRIPTTCLHRAETERTAALHRGGQDPCETGDGDGMHSTPRACTSPSEPALFRAQLDKRICNARQLGAGRRSSKPAAMLIAGSKSPPEKRRGEIDWQKKNIDSGGWHVSSPSLLALRSAAAERREAERAAGYL